MATVRISGLPFLAILSTIRHALFAVSAIIGSGSPVISQDAPDCGNTLDPQILLQCMADNRLKLITAAQAQIRTICYEIDAALTPSRRAYFELTGPEYFGTCKLGPPVGVPVGQSTTTVSAVYVGSGPQQTGSMFSVPCDNIGTIGTGGSFFNQPAAEEYVQFSYSMPTTPTYEDYLPSVNAIGLLSGEQAYLSAGGIALETYNMDRLQDNTDAVTFVAAATATSPCRNIVTFGPGSVFMDTFDGNSVAQIVRTLTEQGLYEPGVNFIYVDTGVLQQPQLQSIVDALTAVGQ